MKVTEWNFGRALAAHVRLSLILAAVAGTPAAATAEEPAGPTPPAATAPAKAPAPAAPQTNASAAAKPAEQPQRVVYTSHSEAMTAIHNHYRAQAGLRPQAVDPNLTAVAQNWANQMAASCSMYHGAGEQIIAYSAGDLSYQTAFSQWLGSSPHRAWLCSGGDRCGFGYAIGRNGCAYYAGAFGSSAAYNPYRAASYSEPAQPQTYTTSQAPAAQQTYYSSNQSSRSRRGRRR